MKTLRKERIVKVLKELGLEKADAEVYVFLAKQGPRQSREVALMLNLDEEIIHKSLKDLQSIEIVKASIEHPFEYEALSFEQVIDIFIEVKKEQAKTMQENKEEILSNWKAIIKKSTK